MLENQLILQKHLLLALPPWRELIFHWLETLQLKIHPSDKKEKGIELHHFQAYL